MNTLIVLLAAALVLFPAGAFVYAAYYLFSLPLRRAEHARLFLDLLEQGLVRGKTPELLLIESSRTGDPSLGIAAHRLAAQLELGYTLPEALRKAPQTLPYPIADMLRVGAEIGDYTKVLPACRNRLAEGVESVSKAQHYLALVALVVTPVWLVIFSLMFVFVIPKLLQILQDMADGLAAPAMLRFLAEYHVALIGIQVLVFLVFYFGIALYSGGPRMLLWIRRLLPPQWVDRMTWMLPWRRKRLLRDFSSVLASLLDSGMPELRALSLAAQATGNDVVKLRTNEMANLLDQGVSLTEAVKRIDDTGDFHWRFSNAARTHSPLTQALAGWHEALAARAFQQEQAAAQLLTSGMVLWNGLMVGLLVISVFAILVRVIQAGILW